MSWRFIDLPPQDAYHMITSFLAVADYVSKGGKNTLMTFYADRPFVNVGFHQEVWLEVDLEFTNRVGIPVVRRDVGGGTVVITPGEQDFFIVMEGENAPRDPSKLYKTYLTPIVNVIRSYGIDAELKDQDVVVRGRKISGNGAMSRGKAVILTGNILLDLDIDLVSKCVRVPAEKFRDKIAKDMREWITTIKNEVGFVPDRKDLVSRIKKAYEETGITFEVSSLTPEEIEYWNRLAEEKKAEDWIFMKDREHPDLRTERCLKINNSVALCHIDYKARKLVRITVRVVNKKVDEVSISGDFFVMSPPDFISKLEGALRGVEPGKVGEVIDRVFSMERPVVFGFEAKDLKEAFLQVFSKPEVQEVT